MKNKYFLARLSQIFVFSFIVSILIGFAVFFRQNINYFQYSLKQKFEIVVFLNLNVTAPEVVGENLRVIDNVREVTFVSKQEVKEKIKDLKEEVIIAGENPFPDTFSILVYFDKLTKDTIDPIIEKLKTINGVDEVRYDNNLVDLIQKLHFCILFTGWILRISAGLLVILLVFKLAMNYGSLWDLIRNKLNYLKIAGGITGSALAVIIIELLKNTLLVPDDFVSVTFKWDAVILISGLITALIVLIEDEKKE